MNNNGLTVIKKRSYWNSRDKNTHALIIREITVLIQCILS